MNTTFISAALLNMDPKLVRACAIWAALRIAEHELPHHTIVCGLADATLSLELHQSASALSLDAANDKHCSSGIRSAIYALNSHNFRIHAHHTLVELAKQQGLHFVHAMLSDLFETNSSPLEFAA